MQIKKMLRMLPCLLGIALVSGCTTNVQVQETEHYDKIEDIKPTHFVVESYPEAVAKTIYSDNEAYAAFSKSEIDKLRAMRAAADKNAEVLRAVVEVNKAIVLERNLMLEAARSEERRANRLGRDYARTEEKLRYEEKMRLIEGALYKLIIVGLVVAL